MNVTVLRLEAGKQSMNIWIPANEDKKLSLSSTSPLNYKLIYSVLFSSPGRMAFAMVSDSPVVSIN